MTLMIGATSAAGIGPSSHVGLVVGALDVLEMAIPSVVSSGAVGYAVGSWGVALVVASRHDASDELPSGANVPRGQAWQTML
jgi:hypothetical protein